MTYRNIYTIDLCLSPWEHDKSHVTVSATILFLNGREYIFGLLDSKLGKVTHHKEVNITHLIHMKTVNNEKARS